MSPPTFLELGFDWVLGTVVGIILNTISQRLGPKDLVKGDPRWSYYVAIFSTALLFPFFAWLSWSTKVSTLSWLGPTPWDALPSVFYDRIYMACLWGYWTKDMLIISDPLIIGHHIACMSALLLVVSDRFVGCLGGFVMITCVLELGTTTYNLVSLYPHVPIARVLYFLGMSGSNVVAGGLTLWVVLLPETPIASKVFYFLVITGLIIGRQNEVFNVYKSPATPPPVVQPTTTKKAPLSKSIPSQETGRRMTKKVHD